MRIAVNTRLLLKDKLEGIGWFTFENFIRITRQHPEHHFYFLFDRPYSNDFIFSDNITPVVLAPQSRHPLLWYIWFEWSVTRFLKKNKIDIFVSPDGYLSLKSTIPQISVIHDINFYHTPQGLPRLTSWYLNHYFPIFAQKATRIVTVSQASKSDIVNCYKVHPNKIDVVYNGAGDIFSPLTETEIAATRREISRNAPYFVFVGAFNPRKNVDGLIQAYSIFRNKTHANVKLLLVGEPMFKTQSIKNTFEQSPYKADIIFAGRKELNALRNIIGASLAMIYPSLFEGFGIPILEAMKCDIPLAVSETTSMPEVAGSAAIYFNPNDTNTIANAMERLWNEPELRALLVQNARIQKLKFSWDNSASNLYNSIITSTKDCRQ
ncbi:MAG: glycosyltransferase family 4 protein [Bacteroidales bacterium]|nr:glycosyltransferase family 4 protein [Bacteroidales bacterium]